MQETTQDSIQTKPNAQSEATADSSFFNPFIIFCFVL